ncbi:hypothetical protein BG011_005711 [Mortierella polycephala]|uniref:FAD-binding domain-containing protein n=1 Tax=Mortierella polycephala TaxID=41804 RepID=A0A9P6QJU8_9FUNG|nr:hypothetical protein BG011_005711 [Mortierella polycephala]
MSPHHHDLDSDDDEGVTPSFFLDMDSSLGVGGENMHIIISGAGLAGLMLANLFEIANISYEIVERCKDLNPYGKSTCCAVMSLNASILPVFEQLGLHEDLKKISYPASSFKFYNGNMRKLAEYVAEDDKERDGYDRIVFSRTLLHELLLRKIPARKLHLGKKFKMLSQSDEGVAIKCTDKTEYYGDILIGADGAHSGVRQNLYWQMAQQGLLPEVDQRTLTKGYTCLLGVTESLDPVLFPGVEGPMSSGSVMISDNSPYTWSVFTIPENKICWNVVIQLTAAESEEEQFRSSEWSVEASEKMLQEIADFPTPFGKLGTIVAATHRDMISRVFLEDILHETWNHERTILVGDSCHKLLPSAGQGAVTALQDAVVLANCLYELPPHPTYEEIMVTLKDFRDQRFQHVKTQYIASQLSAKIQMGHTWSEKILRHIVFNYMPRWIQKRHLVRDMAYVPQVSFLPQIPKRGTGPVLPQKPSKRYQEEKAKQQNAGLQ